MFYLESDNKVQWFDLIYFFFHLGGKCTAPDRNWDFLFKYNKGRENVAMPSLMVFDRWLLPLRKFSSAITKEV